MPLTEIEVDETPHNMDGLLLHGRDGSERVEAFISRRVMDSWVDPREPYRKRRSLLRVQYNALGKHNLAAIERIAVAKYQRGTAFNRQHPFVDILLSDITESEEALNMSELVREPSPPHSIGFHVRELNPSRYNSPFLRLESQDPRRPRPGPQTVFQSKWELSRYRH
jgi:hypothetical protein